MKILRAEGSAGPKFLLSDAFLWTQPFITACLASSSRVLPGAMHWVPLQRLLLKKLECCGNSSANLLLRRLMLFVVPQVSVRPLDSGSSPSWALTEWSPCRVVQPREQVQILHHHSSLQSPRQQTPRMKITSLPLRSFHLPMHQFCIPDSMPKRVASFCPGLTPLSGLFYERMEKTKVNEPY